MRILIVEDEQSLANGLKFNLEQEGYRADVVSEGAAALEHVDQAEPPVDLVILDLMLPGMSGYEVCTSIRESDNQVPILVLSARTLSEDKAHAFACGTDQYMTKPFALPELLSRVRNLLDRRSPQPAASTSLKEHDDEEPFEFGDIRVDFRQFEVTVNDSVHRLTTMEMQLLRYFVKHPGAVLSRSQILEDVWGMSSDVTSRTIDNFVMRLRRVIEPNPASPRRLVSVRGTGYRFLADPDDATD